MINVLALLVAGASAVNAHGHVMSWTIAGETLAGFNPSNAAAYGPTAQRPSDNNDQGFVPEITSARVACGGASSGTGLLTYPIEAGSTITANWDTWPESHKGPIIEYMAACPGTTCDGVDAATLRWFKISESSFEGGVWAGMTLAQTKKWDITIPASIAAGPYLIRHEVIAMHSTGAPQVYPYCVQADITGGGSTTPADTVDIQQAYTMNPDFLTWNLYAGDQSLFKAPGPAVLGGGGTSPAPTPSAPVSSAPVSSAPASSAPASSASAPVAGSSEVPAPSNTDVPTPEETETYPSTPEETYVESTVPTSAVATSAAASSAASSAAGSASVPAQPSASAPAVPSTPATGGGGGKDEDAQKCGREMNICKDKVNSLPNNEVKGDAFAACDTAAAACYASATRKRAVINRYARRSLHIL